MITGRLFTTEVWSQQGSFHNCSRLHSHFGYTGDSGSKSLTPISPPGFPIRMSKYHLPAYANGKNDGVQANCAARHELRSIVSGSSAMVLMLRTLTKATTDRMSSRPRPTPRIRPISRKPTVVANTTHSTDIAMSESRALPVMGMGSVLMNAMIAGREEEGNAKTVEVM